MNKKFIRVFLHSGSKGNPLGEEDIAIYCQCESDQPSVEDVNTHELEKWVNSNRECKKNQSNENYKVSEDTDRMSIIMLSDREVQSCHNANRIFPRLINCVEV